MLKNIPVYTCDICGCRNISDDKTLPGGWDHKAGTDIHYCEQCKDKGADISIADLITADDVAGMLHMSKPSVYTYGRQGRIPGYKKFGPKCIRFDKDRVLNWIKTQGV